MDGKIARTMLYGFVFLLIVLGCLIIFTEKGDRRYDTLDEAIDKGLPHDVKDVIHIRKVEDVTAVMYTFEPDRRELPNADFDYLAVSFFKGNDRDGWKNVGPVRGGHYENDNLTLFFNDLHEIDSEGNTVRDLYIVFGEIHNGEIVKVETRAHDEAELEEADILVHEGKRYYIQEGRELIVRGVAADGTVIDQQGG